MRLHRWLPFVLVIAACGDDAPSDGIVSGSRLRARFLQGGGLRSLMGWQDTARDELCSFQQVGDGTLRCLPAMEWAYVFADAACTQPLTRHYGGACSGDPVPYGGAASDGCATSSMRVWTLGAAQSPAMVYRRSGDACEAVAPEADVTYHAPGEELSLDDFVGATAVRDDAPSRIDRVVLEADDGARQPWGIVDGELDVGCWAEPALGVCIPDDVIGTSHWADDGCSVPLASGYTCGDSPRFVIDVQYDECGWTPTLWERGAEHTAGDVYAGDEASCALAPPTDEPLFEVGAALPLATLAPIAQRLEGGGRLRRNAIVSDDGLHYLRGWGWYDDELAAPCYPATTIDGTTRCVPDGGTAGSYFADPACTEPQRITSQSVTACDSEELEPPRFALRFDENACETVTVAYEVGAEVQPGTVFFEAGDACVPQTWDTAIERRFLVGNEVLPSSLVALDEVTQ